VILAILAVTYYFTYEPAPEISIRWREGVTWEQRTAIERQHGLRRTREQDEESWTYDLIDIRTSNIRSLLEQHEVEDTGVVDRLNYVIPSDAPYGEGWMWVGNRLPLLRSHGVVPTIIFACSATLLYALISEIRARRKRVLRLAAFLLGTRRPRFQGAGERLADHRGVVP
jgi:hypothetical protein